MWSRPARSVPSICGAATGAAGAPLSRLVWCWSALCRSGSTPSSTFLVTLPPVSAACTASSAALKLPAIETVGGGTVPASAVCAAASFAAFSATLAASLAAFSVAFAASFSALACSLAAAFSSAVGFAPGIAAVVRGSMLSISSQLDVTCPLRIEIPVGLTTSRTQLNGLSVVLSRMLTTLPWSAFARSGSAVGNTAAETTVGWNR